MKAAQEAFTMALPAPKGVALEQAIMAYLSRCPSPERDTERLLRRVLRKVQAGKTMAAEEILVAALAEFDSGDK